MVRGLLSGAVMVTSLLLCVCARADVPAINAEGTFSDGATWIYETPQHTFGFSNLIKGTNENITVLPPDVPLGMTPVGVELMRHDMDFHGYPLRISLVDKLFSAKEKVTVYAAMNGDRRKYEPGSFAGKEDVLAGNAPADYSVAGPLPASGSIPTAFQDAFDYAKGVLSQLNLPTAQKSLNNYVVMFVETSSTTWIEFGPMWGTAEAPHLGCQTSLGRDMVFGYEKRPSGDKHGGPFLQCF